MDLFQIADTLSSLSTAQSAELVEMLETRWNVRVPQPTVIVPPEPEPVEPTAFDVRITDVGSDRIQVIRAIRALTGSGLLEARKMIDALPAVILEARALEAAEAARDQLVAAGATVELVP